MSWKIIPYTSIGPLELESERDKVRSVLGSPDKTFKRAPSDANETDIFLQSSVFVSYDAACRCEAVELTQPIEPMIDGFNPLGLPFSTVWEWFKQHDPSVVSKRTGLLSHKYGISIYAPSCLKQPDNPVEGVMAFKRGYW